MRPCRHGVRSLDNVCTSLTFRLRRHSYFEVSIKTGLDVVRIPREAQFPFFYFLCAVRQLWTTCSKRPGVPGRVFGKLLPSSGVAGTETRVNHEQILDSLPLLPVGELHQGSPYGASESSPRVIKLPHLSFAPLECKLELDNALPVTISDLVLS